MGPAASASPSPWPPSSGPFSASQLVCPGPRQQEPWPSSPARPQVQPQSTAGVSRPWARGREHSRGRGAAIRAPLRARLLVSAGRAWSWPVEPWPESLALRLGLALRRFGRPSASYCRMPACTSAAGAARSHIKRTACERDEKLDRCAAARIHTLVGWRSPAASLALDGGERQCWPIGGRESPPPPMTLAVSQCLGSQLFLCLSR